MTATDLQGTVDGVAGMGGLSRAAELALSSLEAELPLPALESLHSPDPAEIARRLSSCPAIDGRVRQLPRAELERASLAGAAVLAQVDSRGWLVVHGGRATLVSESAEQRVSLKPWRLGRLGLSSEVRAVVLEPRLPLSRLSRHRVGGAGPWGRLRGLLSVERRDVVGLVAYAVVLGGLSLSVPVAVQVLVNTIAFGSMLQPLVVLSVLLLGVLAFSALLQMVQWYAVELLQRRIFVRVAEDFSRRMLTLRYESHDEVDTRELSNRFFELATLQKTVSSLMLDGLALLLQMLTGLLLLGFYHPVLLAFDVLLILGLSSVIALGYGTVESAQRESSAKYAMAAWLQTLAASPLLFLRPRAALFGARRADALVRSYLGARRVHYRRLTRQLLGGLSLQVLALVGLLGLGGFLVMQGELTLGQLVAAELVVGSVGVGFAKLGKQLEKGYDLLAGVDKLGKVVDLPAETLAASPSSLQGPIGLHLQDLQLDPGGGARPLAMSGRIRPGARVRLRAVAPEAGSRFLELLSGARRQVGGTLAVQGHEGSAQGLLRARAALVRPREVIAGTIIDNLRLAQPDVTEARALSCLEVVGLRDAVARLPEGLQTPIFPAGGALSSSQQTLLGLARALLAEPSLLLIDRALDQLWLEGEVRAALLRRLLGPDAPWTVVVSTEDPAVAALCDETLALGGIE